MATWRNWLRTLLPWTKEEQAATAPAPAAASTPIQSNSSPAAAPVPLPPPSQPTIDLTQLPASFPLQPLKTWISQNVSFYAWDRVVLRCLPTLRREGISLAEAMNPNPVSRVSRESLQAILQTLYELYQITIPPILLQQA